MRFFCALSCLLLLAACVPDDGWGSGQRSSWDDVRAPADEGSLFGPPAGSDAEDPAGEDQQQSADDDDASGDDDDQPATDDDDAWSDDDDAWAADDDDAALDDDDDDDDDAWSSDDDDAWSDDDDAWSSDDDDLVEGDGLDDDDAAVDDDDATPADELTGPGNLTLLIEAGETTTFPSTPTGSSYAITVELENTGGEAVSGEVILDTLDMAGTWSLDGAPTFLLLPGATQDRDIVFNPFVDGSYQVIVQFEHDGANLSPQSLVFNGTGGTGAGETDCANGVDDDLDGNADCNDMDCAPDPACSLPTDLCCFAGGNGSTSGLCEDAAARDCTCTIDVWCCGIGWDADCVDTYTNACVAETCGLGM